MKVIQAGHVYEVAGSADGGPQTLKFHHKVFGGGAEGWESVENYPGTTNEEMLEVLIDRMQFLQQQFPCRQNAIVITKLEEARMWLEDRTKDRVKRGVEGKHTL